MAGFDMVTDWSVCGEQGSTALGARVFCRMHVDDAHADELMHTTGYPTGFINLMSSQALDRGLVVYSIFYVLYLILAHYSPNTKGPIFVAGSISIFFMAFTSTS